MSHLFQNRCNKKENKELINFRMHQIFPDCPVELYFNENELNTILSTSNNINLYFEKNCACFNSQLNLPIFTRTINKQELDFITLRDCIDCIIDNREWFTTNSCIHKIHFIGLEREFNNNFILNMTFD